MNKIAAGLSLLGGCLLFYISIKMLFKAVKWSSYRSVLLLYGAFCIFLLGGGCFLYCLFNFIDASLPFGLKHSHASDSEGVALRPLSSDATPSSLEKGQ